MALQRLSQLPRWPSARKIRWKHVLRWVSEPVAARRVRGPGLTALFVDARVISSPVQETQAPALRGFLEWAGQGSNLRPWD
jgi:hypothetical protein